MSRPSNFFFREYLVLIPSGPSCLLKIHIGWLPPAWESELMDLHRNGSINFHTDFFGKIAWDGPGLIHLYKTRLCVKTSEALRGNPGALQLSRVLGTAGTHLCCLTETWWLCRYKNWLSAMRSYCQEMRSQWLFLKKTTNMSKYHQLNSIFNSWSNVVVGKI